MNGILVIVAGVLILYLVLSGRMDCFIKAAKVCAQGDASGGTSPTNTVSPATAAQPSQTTTATQTLGNVLSPTIGI